MANIPIKVLLDKDRSPFIPFSTTSSIVENGTNRRLDKILGNLDDLQTNNKNSLVSAINEVLVGSGSGAGINIQIVDELPTENISLTTIYFKHMTTTKPHNVYEEWMYINNAWELIGTTEMDLSGYATTAMVGDLSTLKTTDKDSVVDAVNELVDKQLVAGDGIELDGNVIKAVPDFSIYNIYYAKPKEGEDYILINDLPAYRYPNDIGQRKKINILPVGLNLKIRKADGTISDLTGYVNLNDNSSIKGFRAITIQYSGESLEEMTGNYATVTMFTYEADTPTYDLCYLYKNSTSFTNPGSTFPHGAIATNGQLSFYYARKDNVLTKTNTTSYTPSADYHPATKKYVDDKVAEGSGSGVDLSNYLAKDNTTEFTPTGDYNPSTKKYVDDKFSAVPLIDSYTKTEVDTKLANYLAKDNLTEYTPTSDYHPATKKFVESVVSSIDMSGYYSKTEINTFLSRQNTRFYFSNPNIAQTVTNEFQDISIYNSSDTAVEKWATGKMENGTDNKLCVYTAKIGKPHYLEVTVTYEADDELVFNNFNSLTYWYRLKDDGTEERVGTFIGQYTPADRENYHVVKYLLYLWGSETLSDIYLKRTSNMKCKTKDSTTITDLNITVVPWLPFWES